MDVDQSAALLWGMCEMQLDSQELQSYCHMKLEALTSAMKILQVISTFVFVRDGCRAAERGSATVSDWGPLAVVLLC